jgi:hypothetical protein
MNGQTVCVRASDLAGAANSVGGIRTLRRFAHKLLPSFAGTPSGVG